MHVLQFFIQISMHICDPYVSIAHDSKSPCVLSDPYVGIANFSFHHSLPFTFPNILYQNQDI